MAKIRQISNAAVALGLFLVVALGFSAASPRRVFSEENHTSIRWPDAKLDGESIYFRPFGKTATIQDGTLHMKGYEKGF